MHVSENLFFAPAGSNIYMPILLYGYNIVDCMVPIPIWFIFQAHERIYLAKSEPAEVNVERWHKIRSENGIYSPKHTHTHAHSERRNVEFSNFYCRNSEMRETPNLARTRRTKRRGNAALFVANVTLNSITQHNNAIANCRFEHFLLLWLLCWAECTIGSDEVAMVT